MLLYAKTNEIHSGEKATLTGGKMHDFRTLKEGTT
jgi:hypothetical protein